MYNFCLYTLLCFCYNCVKVQEIDYFYHHLVSFRKSFQFLFSPWLFFFLLVLSSFSGLLAFHLENNLLPGSLDAAKKISPLSLLSLSCPPHLPSQAFVLFSPSGNEKVVSFISEHRFYISTGETKDNSSDSWPLNKKRLVPSWASAAASTTFRLLCKRRCSNLKKTTFLRWFQVLRRTVLLFSVFKHSISFSTLSSFLHLLISNMSADFGEIVQANFEFLLQLSNTTLFFYFQFSPLFKRKQFWTYTCARPRLNLIIDNIFQLISFTMPL